MLDFKINKEKLSICLFILPFVSRWIFPVSIENVFTISIFSFPIYIFDLMYLFFPFIAKSNISKKDIYVFFLLLLYFGVGLLGHVTFSSYPAIFILLTNQPIIFALLLVIIYPFNKRQILFVKNIFITSFIILAAQIIFGSLGIVNFGTAPDHDIAGVFRISTTIGAATGTGVVMVLLGGLIVSVYLKGLKRLLFILLLISCVLLTISRGSSIALFLFLLVFLYKELRYSKNRLSIILGFTFVIIFFAYMGLLDPILQRMDNQKGDMTTGRDVIFEKALFLIKNNLSVGIGFNNVFPEKSLLFSHGFKAAHYIPAHNYYLIVLAESGIIGFLLLISVFSILLLRMNHRKSLIFYLLLITHLVLMNVEGVLLWKEYAFMLAFLYSIGIYKLDVE